ncbi:MAG: beta-propeller fold lactonase family protein [Chromatiales bacterium]|nr:beta-propeller fold lactonase family protein [Chromatiales bacterium]
MSIRLSLFFALLWLCGPALAAPFLFVSNPNGNNLLVIDAATNTVAGTLPVGNFPSGTAVTPDSSRAFVANTADDTLTVIDLDDGDTRTIAVGDQPAGMDINPAGTFLYVANAADDTVSVVNLTSETVVATIPVGNNPMDVAAGDTKVYVANFGDNTVTVINAATNTVTASVLVPGFSAGIAMNPAQSRVYVSQHMDGFVYVIDTGTDTVADAVTVGANPRGVDVSPDGSRVYVSNFGDGTVSVIETAMNGVIATVNVNQFNPIDVQVNAGGTQVYVANFAGNSLSVINTAGNSVSSVATGCCLLGFGGFATQVPATLVPPAAPPAPLAITPVPTLSTLAKIALAGLLATVVSLALGKKRRSAGLLTVVGLLYLFSPVAKAQASYILFDTEFEDADWEVFSQSVNGSSLQSVSQDPLIDGNPPPSREMRHRHAVGGVEDAITVVHRYIGPANSYDPAGSAVNSITFSWDEGFETAPEAVNLTGAFVVIQGGTVYTVNTGPITQTFPQATGPTTVTAGDFSPPGLNLSTAGGPLTFGYRRQSNPEEPADFRHNIDNYRVVLNLNGETNPSTIGFQTNAITDLEGQDVTVTIVRSGDLTEALSAVITLDNSPGTATPDIDYGFPDPPRVSWAPGEGGNKSLVLSFRTDAAFEGLETIHINLTVAAGSANIDPFGNRLIAYIVDTTEEVSPIAILLFSLILLFFEQFQVGWLLLLSLPLAVVIYRRWRKRV